MLWLLNLVFVGCMALVLVLYVRAVMEDRELVHQLNRIYRLKLTLSLLLIEIKIVMETPRDGQQLDQAELLKMTQTIESNIRRLEYTRLSLGL